MRNPSPVLLAALAALPTASLASGFTEIAVPKLPVKEGSGKPESVCPTVHKSGDSTFDAALHAEIAKSYAHMRGRLCLYKREKPSPLALLLISLPESETPADFLFQGVPVELEGPWLVVAEGEKRRYYDLAWASENGGTSRPGCSNPYYKESRRGGIIPVSVEHEPNKLWACNAKLFWLFASGRSSELFAGSGKLLEATLRYARDESVYASRERGELQTYSGPDARRMRCRLVLGDAFCTEVDHEPVEFGPRSRLGRHN